MALLPVHFLDIAEAAAISVSTGSGPPGILRGSSSHRQGWGDATRDRPKNATRRGLPYTETVTPPPEPPAITVGHQGSLASCTLGGMGEFYFLQEGQLSRGGDGRGAAGPA